MGTKDAKTLKQYQQFFLGCIVLIILMMDMSKPYPSHVLVLFSNVMDGLRSSFSPQNSLCMMMASNQSSNNTVMRESVLDIVLLNDVSLKFAISTLTAS
jgi:hypothetical protein